MPTVDVVDLENKVVGSVDLSDRVFAAEVNQDLLYQAVHHYQAGQRAGTHKTKTRAEVSGGGAKPWKQKGTGRSRAGSTRSPLWRHGGVTHGPQPRDYSYHLPRKMLLGALRSSLTARLQDGAIKVVKDFSLETHKTKDFRAILDAMSLRKKILIVSNDENENLRRSSRNLRAVTVMGSAQIHPYHLLRHEAVVFTESAIRHCSEVLA